jgi:uncharacterized membrane protein
MALGQHKRAVGVFSSRHDAENAMNELNRSGFPMNNVSIIARDAGRGDDIAGVDVSGRVGNKADEGATAGALTGGTLGGLTGLLVGLGSLAIPGVGPVILAGEIATTLATTLAGGAIGAAAGGLLGGLIGLGIPEERARRYNDRVSRGDYLVLVNGSDAELARAEAILNHRGIEDWGVYNSPAVDPTYTPMSMGGGFPGASADYTPVTGMPVGYTPPVTPTPIGYNTPATGTTTGMAVERNKRAVGVFNTRREAENALNELRNSGFSMDQVNVVNKNADGDEIAGVDVSNKAGNKADDGAVTGAVTGGALGGIGGLLVGLGALAIPGIGPVMLAGATATAIATTLSGGAIGAAAGGLAGALIGLGIPEEEARSYNERLSRGHYLVFVDGRESEVRRAAAILSNRGIQDWAVYDAPDLDTPHRSEYVATNTATTDYGTNVVDTTTATTDYGTNVVETDPKITIIDRRDPTV